MKTPPRIVTNIPQNTRREAAGLLSRDYKLSDDSETSFGEVIEIIDKSLPETSPIAGLNRPKQSLRSLKITLGALGKEGSSVDFGKCQTSLQNGHALIKAYAEQLEESNAGIVTAGDARSEWGVVTAEGEGYRLNMRGKTKSLWNNPVMSDSKSIDVLSTAQKMLTSLDAIANQIGMTTQAYEYSQSVE